MSGRVCRLCTLDEEVARTWRKTGGILPEKKCRGHIGLCRTCEVPNSLNRDSQCDECWLQTAIEQMRKKLQDGTEMGET